MASSGETGGLERGEGGDIKLRGDLNMRVRLVSHLPNKP